MQKAITRARNKEQGIEEEEIKVGEALVHRLSRYRLIRLALQEVPTFPLINIPDHQLTEEQLKEKRRQKLNKAGYDARMRMKADRDAAKAREVKLIARQTAHNQS